MEMDDVERALFALLAEDDTRQVAVDDDAADALVPLSAAQRTIWFLQQYDVSSTAYNLDRLFVVHGEFDVCALHRALQHVCQRHDILRTRIVDNDGQPTQVVDDAFRFPLIIEAAVDAPHDLSATIADFARRHVGRPFDLNSAPPVRGAVCECGQGRTLIALAMHHILSDAWSNLIWMREIALAYEAFRHGRDAVDLPALPLQYAHYARRQRAYLAGSDYRDDVAYWCDYLRDIPDALTLPKCPGSSATEGDTGHFRFALRKEEVTALDGYCVERRTGRFAVLLGVWQVLLAKLSNQASFLVGVPSSGRLWPDVEHLIGCFVNTHVYRASIDCERTLDDVIQSAQTASIAALNHGNVPFDMLVNELGVKRTTDENPLFQVLFDFKVADKPHMLFGDASVSPVPIPASGRKFDLSLSTSAAPDEIDLVFEYATHRFNAEAAVRWADAYRAILSVLFTDRDRQVGQIDILDDGQRSALRKLSCPAPVVMPREPVHTVIKTRSERTPDAIALVYGAQSLRYGELDGRANRLAHRLVRLGVGPEVRVGIAIERSIDLIVGLLAILKAGGAYVPLDPEYPQDRLAYMIEDSGVALLLTQSHVRASLPIPEGLIALDLDTLDISSELSSDPEVSVDVENAAYVIYTSGSTGRPKGVVNRHSALTNRIVWMQDAYGLDATDTVLQKTPFSFDVSVWEFFWPLMYGAKLAVAKPGDHRDPARLVELIDRHNVTTLHFVPPMLQAFVAHDGTQKCTSLKRIVCSGEALPAELANRALALLPNVGVYNLYGPTEAAIDVTHWTCIPVADSVPIGRPIANIQTYVLDDALNLAPRGVAGELYLGGVGLARGYLNRPSLTAERFVADPFGTNGERLYRTGDLARWNADDALEYLGRLDHQVKIRGFRIELGEIESQLVSQDSVREAVVTAQTGAGGTRLIGYVTATEGHVIDVAVLRAALSVGLPDYMVPSVLMVLAAMPLSPNGKVDRRALPASELASTVTYASPEGEAEQALAAIWCDVLGVARVGRHDNFFELGGDSILSLQIVARAREAGWGLTPRQLFECQTVKRLAGVAQRRDVMAAEVAVEQGAVPLLPIQARFFDTPMENRSHWNQAVLLTGSQALDDNALEIALRRLVAHHGALRLRYTQDAAGVWQQHYADDAATAINSVVLWQREATELAEVEVLCDEAQRSLDLTEGALIRALLIRLPDDGWRLLLSIHHLAVDGVSWRILLDDLQSAYKQALVGETIVLPPNGTTYQTWANRIGLHAHDTAVRRELAYWREIVDTPAWIPVDDPRGDATLANQNTTSRRLDSESTQRLLKAVPVAYRTQINDVLLTALGRVLCEWTGTEAVRIDLEGHGREDLFDGVDLSRTVGWFTSLYPVKLVPLGDPGVALMRVKESLRGVPQRGLGFGLLTHLGDASDRAALGGAPSSVVFNYLGQFDRSFAAGTGWTPASEGSGRTMDETSVMTHDLTINARIYEGQLTVSIGYSRARFAAETVETFIQAYVDALRMLIAHCVSGAAGVTPSDFPLSGLTQSELDTLPMPAPLIEDLYPSSPMQLGMLFHTLYEPTSSAYINQLRIDVDGLDVGRFRAAWDAATARHAILRTGFLRQDDGWLQWVARETALPFVRYDWGNRSDRAAAIDALAAEELSRGFDVACPPLQRIVLVATGGGRHHLIWTYHHLLMDGWSTSQLMGDILRHYAGRTMPQQGARYRDYIGWLRQRDVDAGARYWSGLLAAQDAPTRLLHAVRRDADVDRTDTLGEYRYALDEHATSLLVEFARHCRVTVNTLVQGAWSLVLQRYTGQKSVVFGATVAGRPADLPGAEQMLGLFINTIPVVAAPRGEDRLGDWLSALQAQGIASQEHMAVPLYDIQRLTRAGAEGLFDTLLVFENYPIDEALKSSEPGGLTFGELIFREQTNYPLTLGVTLSERLHVTLRYASARISAASVARLALQMGRLLSHFAARGAGARVDDITLLDDADRRDLMALGRDDAMPRIAAPVHTMIDERARSAPNGMAVVCGAASLRYGELNARANRLAHRLVRLGVGPEVRVGIAMARSIDLIVSLLAVLKAGGAYVPLDPDYPRERLSYMIEDSGISLLLTHSALRGQGTLPDTVRVLDVDVLDVSSEPSTRPDVHVDDGNLAYVIYTSGSTGRPKGVAVAHGALAQHCVAIGARYALTPEDRLLQFASISFDAAQEQWLVPLMSGAALIMRDGGLWSTERLADALRREQVSVLYLPPAYIDECARSIDADGVHVRTCIVGGEAWSRAGFEAVRDRLHATRIFNAYGPAETVITPTVWEADGETQIDQAYAPIGRPVGDRAAYVLDGSQNLVPRGVIGELYLGGACMARGYLNRPGLTSERFVPNGFGDKGERLYRTGDLVRWNAAGELEYVSRTDHQVKIRGFRIELGEIEAQLLACAAVREAVVVARDVAQNSRLVGYVTAKDEAVIDVAALHAALADVLPDYMVPALLIVLQSMPLNPNGKVDRNALPEPALSSTGAYEAPEGEAEQALAAIWREVLGVERIGRHDNFFQLGGHSLRALQVQRRLARQVGVEIPLTAFFGSGSLRDIAETWLSTLEDSQASQRQAVTDMQSLLSDLID